jgi:hypothetical protein
MVNTFLPFPDFAKTAACLDKKRLFKQLVECRQIGASMGLYLIKINGLPYSKNGWKNHPAKKMWEGHVDCLMDYHDAILFESLVRGIQTEIGFYHDSAAQRTFFPGYFPWWLGNNDFHLSHQSNLLRKDSEHYGQYFQDVSNDLPYWWPSEHLNERRLGGL